jgi:ribose-phosphate pyrophosphokinase
MATGLFKGLCGNCHNISKKAFKTSVQLHISMALLFYTNSVKHLASKINMPMGKFVIKKFSDGEIYVRVDEDVKDKQVWVLTAIQSDNVLELAFLLDALNRAKASINLFITYFGYARQNAVNVAGEALSAEVICNLLKMFNPKKITVMHIHNTSVNQFIDFSSEIPVELYGPIIDKTADVVVAPDKGAAHLAHTLASPISKGEAFFEKIRPKQEEAIMKKLVGDVKGKNVIIVDDLISTGGTILEAAKRLKEEGAKDIQVLATHGVFTDGAIEKLEGSPISKVHVTNSLAQTHNSKKVNVIDLSGFIEKIILNN